MHEAARSFRAAPGDDMRTARVQGSRVKEPNDGRLKVSGVPVYQVPQDWLTLRLAQRGPLELAVALKFLDRLHAPCDQHKGHHMVGIVPQLVHLIHL